MLFRNGLIDAAFPNACKVVLLRNGADICQSIENWSEAHGDADVDWWGLDDQKWQLLVDQLVLPDPFFETLLPVVGGLTRHVDRAAVEWIVSMREAVRLREGGAAGMLLVRYEELVDQRRAVLTEILEFCDLKPDTVMLDYGSRVLRTGTTHAVPKLHPVLQVLFDETMKTMGYGEVTAI